jgi:hypothetical protein
MRSNKLYKIAIQFEQNLGDFLRNNPDQFQRMEQIDADSFEQYTDFDYSQSEEDLKDDFEQPGAFGTGVTDDNGNLIGYVYGYNLTHDEFDVDKNITNDDLIEQFGVKFYMNVPPMFAKQIRNLMKQGKVFYIANFAFPTESEELSIKNIGLNKGRQILQMLRKLRQQLKQNGYEYVAFDALSDTMQLFMGQGMVPNAARLALFGVKAVAAIPDPDEPEHAQILLKI